jgi:hypothetical protein
MPAYRGSSLNISWVTSAGTVDLSGDFRTVSYNPSIDLVDQTAGSDSQKTYIAGLKDGQISFSAVMQAGGTLLTNSLVEGTGGTLFVSPEGTASTKQKITLPAIAMGARYNIPYADIVEVSCDFQQNGARVDGVN